MQEGPQQNTFHAPYFPAMLMPRTSTSGEPNTVKPPSGDQRTSFPRQSTDLSRSKMLPATVKDLLGSARLPFRMRKPALSIEKSPVT